MGRKPEGEAIDEMAQARRYHAVMGRGLMQHEYRHIGRQVAQMLPDGGRVLDIGTGPGYVAIETAARLGCRAEIVGLDLSEAMLTIAADNAGAARLQGTLAWTSGTRRECRLPMAPSTSSSPAVRSTTGVTRCACLPRWRASSLRPAAT